MLQEEYQMKLLKLARNEAKQRMYKSKSNIVIKKTQLSIDDYDTLITITDNIKEEHFIKKKEHLILKYNNWKNTADHLHVSIETTASIIKEGKELDENKIKLLNLGPKLVPTKNDRM